MPIFVLIFVSLSIVFAIAALMWKRWGFLGLGVITIMPVIISVVLSLTSEFDINFVRDVLIANTIVTVVLVILLRPVWKQLQWK